MLTSSLLLKVNAHLNQGSDGGCKGLLRVHAKGADGNGNRLRSHMPGLCPQSVLYLQMSSNTTLSQFCAALI